jgi:hypothetical protein
MSVFRRGTSEGTGRGGFDLSGTDKFELEAEKSLFHSSVSDFMEELVLGQVGASIRALRHSA